MRVFISLLGKKSKLKGSREPLSTNEIENMEASELSKECLTKITPGGHKRS